MGRLIISENVTLDGVMQDPGGDEGFRRGGWFLQASEQDRAAWAAAEYAESLEASALLFGRGGYEWFAARWPARTGPWAERLTGLPKYVVTSTLAEFAWANTACLEGDPLVSVADLKERIDGDVVLYASGALARTLLRAGMVDEVRLIIFPSVLGEGERLFDSVDAPPMQLVNSQLVGSNLVSLTYRPRADDQSQPGAPSSRT